MNNFDVDKTLESLVVTIDTREQDTDRLKRRITAMDCEIERCCLDYGDYSCKCTLPSGEVLDFSTMVVVERKESINEICTNFSKGRDRFVREFEKAKNDNCKVYLLIENASWESIYNGKYKSKFNPNALVASLCAWFSRYNATPIFCKDETSGKIIKDILYRELKEYLGRMKEGGETERDNSISSGG